MTNHDCRETADVLTRDAPAKVNLTLEVLGKRPDGYHEIRSVVQAISLADRLVVAADETLHLSCSRSDLEGHDNLVWRAAELLRAAAGCRRGARMHLEKRVPVAAGLGGGSSDAAAALRALNALWNLGLSPAALRGLGAQLGSDVPFFLGESGAALVEGRGERITPLAALPRRWVVLVKPPAGIAAAAAYGALTADRWSDGQETLAWLRRAATGSLPAPFNALEAAALAVAPEASAGRIALQRAGAPAPIMSGSGSTYFTLFDDRGAAAAVLARLHREGCEAYVAEFLPVLPDAR
jgi:4-diphosphocytidyl-2-C-methyl-D-erythritol kinase